MLNSTICCKTIGCNCAGTTSIEMLGDVTSIKAWLLPVGIIAVFVIVLFLAVLIINVKGGVKQNGEKLSTGETGRRKQ